MSVTFLQFTVSDSSLQYVKVLICLEHVIKMYTLDCTGLSP